MELSRAKIVARLERDGWTNEGGAKHDRFHHPVRSAFLIVPRHRTLTTFVARSIAKAAGWSRE